MNQTSAFNLNALQRSEKGGGALELSLMSINL